jgi:chorismate dehydratase
MNLTIGHITYANCTPFFHFLGDAGFNGRIAKGVPSALNRLLSTGEIDLSPSSSFEYGCNWRDYLLLPGLSISSRGPVQSVLLFSSRPIEKMQGEEIALTGESATSVNLLRVLLKEFAGWAEVRCEVPDRPVEEVIAAGGTALLIGDRALRAASNNPDRHVVDLGEAWSRYTGLPFVFAMWILRRDAALEKREEVRTFLRQLRQSTGRALGELDVLADRAAEYHWLGKERLIDYWRSMSYDLTDEHLQGLRLFFSLCCKHGLLDEVPEIRFFE